MREKRIIPCLDIFNGKVVKGINFIGLREVGEPIAYAMEYAKQGADEIVFLNIASSPEGREGMIELVYEAAKRISVPITVGGGIGSTEDIRRILQAGAGKVSINSAAVKRPELIREAAAQFGSRSIIAAVDGKKAGKGRYHVMIEGGKRDTGIDLKEWAKKVELLGAGEILLTSMDNDGVKNGFDISMLNYVCDGVDIPVIASGGCGTVGHFVKVFQDTQCDAALAASIFHYGDLTVDEVKKALAAYGIPVKENGEGACA
ncbi:imidazole glycerol phosphate synthase subunit HisF [Bacillota bacterium]